VNENEDKKQFEQLNRDSQAEIKGGIPYEKPVLISLDSTEGTCGVGTYCDKGNPAAQLCKDGSVCSVGDTSTIDPIK